MRREKFIIIFLAIALFGGCKKENQFKSESPYGQFAPKDAYSENPNLAYYGAENEWTRRMFSQKAADRFYKRRGQRQMLAILDGHPEQAMELCEKRLAADPNDQESLFVLAVALTQLQKLNEAMDAVQLAVDAGLPFARFVAGPRDLLKPLTETTMFRQYAERHPLRLVHGPLLGCMTDHSVRFWMRTTGEDQVKVRAWEKDNPGNVLESGTERSSAQQDYVVIAKVEGLVAKRKYVYNVWVNGQSVFETALPTFTTFPAPGTAGHFRIVFGGGAGYTPQHERIWNVIGDQRPDALLLLGDNVYIDLPQMPGPFHQYTYYRRQSRPEFRHLVQSTPVYAIWDDHDAAIDDVWLGPYKDKPAWKMPMLNFFRRQWNNPGYGTAEWPGVWFKFAIGDVDFIMLDCRMYRTNPFASEKTMLGAVQKAWLKDQLAKSTATFKIVVSSVPWASGAKPGSKDTWDGFASEREEIFSFIANQKINGVILLSADRHRSDAWKVERKDAYPLYDLMSSKLTNIHTHELMTGALFGYNKKCSFGLLTFNTESVDPEVKYQIVNIDGDVVHSLSIRKSQLECK